MEKKKYNLFDYFIELENNNDFKNLKSSFECESNTFSLIYNETEAKIYTVEMYYILNDKRFNENKFYIQYIDGFNKGIDFVRKKTKKALKGLYVNNSKDYIKQLELDYSKHDKKTKSYPVQFYIEELEKYGFSSGIVCEIDLMKNENPILFKDFLNNQNEEPQPTKENNQKKPYWFKIGLLFANGEMDILLKQFNSNCTKIAKHLGNNNYRPYISESIANTTNSDKNIYSSKKKMDIIINHCKQKNINVINSFIERLPME